MSSPRQILSYLRNYFDKRDIVKKKKLKALVTAGPTREYIDPIRYISNESGGKQGYEIAIALDKLGIKTTLITGPCAYPKGVKVRKIITADEMLNEVKKTLPVDLAVCTAAVTDLKPAEKNKYKIKKDELNFQSINFVKNTDILNFLSKNNRNRPQIVAGFSAETKNVIKNFKEKMKNKNCDLIFANDVSKKDIGFNSDFNKVSILDQRGKINTIQKIKSLLLIKLLKFY